MAEIETVRKAAETPFGDWQLRAQERGEAEKWTIARLAQETWNAALEEAAACDFTMRTVACPDEHYAEVAQSAVQSAIEGKSAAILRLKEDPDGK